MEVLSISWAGVRTQDFAATVRYFARNLNLALTLRDDQSEVAHFRCASGDLFEIFGSNTPTLVSMPVQFLPFKLPILGSLAGKWKVRGLSLSQTLTPGKMRPGALSGDRTVIFMF